MSECDRPKTRCLVLAPFFSNEVSASRPKIVAEVLVEFGSVDIVTTSFDHQSKRPKKEFQYADGRIIHYLPTLVYRRNVSAQRFLSHFFFSIRAWLFYLKRRNQYDVIYSTVPLNLLSVLVFLSCPTKLRIVDVVDIWPDVLPFPWILRRIASPFFAFWKQTFKWSIGHSDLLLAVSDSFLEESLPYFRSNRSFAHRVYIGCQRLPQRKKISSDYLTIVYIGNIGKLYDFKTLLTVLSTIPEKVRFFIIGDGDRKNWLLQELSNLQIEFEYFGIVYDEDQLADILSQCDVGFNGYFNTSAAFSYKANTYFSANLPILNSMSGDLEHLVVKYGLGFNYLPENVESLRRAIERCTSSMLDKCSLNVIRFFDEEIELNHVKSLLAKHIASLISPNDCR